MPPRVRRKVVPIHSPKHAPVHPFDRVHHTDTGGLIPGTEILTGHPNDAHLTAYYAVAPSILNALIDLWQGTRPAFAIDRYTFLDIGAGKGRAVLAAAAHPFQEALGIEINASLCEVARRNLEAFAKHGSPLCEPRILEGDALALPLPAGPTLAFLFHPFEAPLVRRLLRRLEDHAAGVLDVLYVNAEHALLFDNHPAFERVFHGLVPMSAEDHLADLAEIAGQTEYGSTGDELCAIYRLRADEKHRLPR